MSGTSIRLGNILRPLQLIWFSIKLHYLAFKDSLSKNGLIPTLTHPNRIRAAAQANLFITTSSGFIAFENTTPLPTLLLSATGAILELGPGPGNQLQRYSPSLVHSIHAIDPNPLYGAAIAAKLTSLPALKEKYTFLACGIEDADFLAKEGVVEGSMDTVLSIQVLCAVGDVEGVMRTVWRLLKPGGSFVFWEHGRSGDGITAGVQACLNPAWSTFVGCCLTRDIKKAILEAGEWENPEEIEVGDDPYSYLPRVWGVLRKKA